MEGAWQHVAKGFSVTRDGSQMISVMRDRAQVGHEMPQNPDSQQPTGNQIIFYLYGNLL